MTIAGAEAETSAKPVPPKASPLKFSSAKVSGASRPIKLGLDKLTSTAAKARTYSAQNVEAVFTSLAAANKGASAIRIQTMELPQSIFKESAAAAKSLSQVKNVQDVVDVYGKFATALLKLHLNELNRASTTVSESFANTVGPLKTRVTQSWPYHR